MTSYLATHTIFISLLASRPTTGRTNPLRRFKGMFAPEGGHTILRTELLAMPIERSWARKTLLAVIASKADGAKIPSAFRTAKTVLGLFKSAFRCFNDFTAIGTRCCCPPSNRQSKTGFTTKPATIRGSIHPKDFPTQSTFSSWCSGVFCAINYNFSTSILGVKRAPTYYFNDLGIIFPN